MRENLTININVPQKHIPNNMLPRTSRAVGLSFSLKLLCFPNKQMLTEHCEVSTCKCYKKLSIKPLKVFIFLKYLSSSLRPNR